MDLGKKVTKTKGWIKLRSNQGKEKLPERGMLTENKALITKKEINKSAEKLTLSILLSQPAFPVFYAALPTFFATVSVFHSIWNINCFLKRKVEKASLSKMDS